MSLRTCLVAVTLSSAALYARADTIQTFHASGILSGNLTLDTTRGSVVSDTLVLNEKGTPVELNFGGGSADGRTGYLFSD